MVEPDESPVTLDEKRFASVAESLAGELDYVIAQFLELSLANSSEIERASSVEDHEATREAAHRLKGSSMALGAPRLRDLSAAIERAATACRTLAPGEIAAVRAEISAAHVAMARAASTARSAG